MYVDKLDGRIDEGFYKRMRAQWRDEQERRERDIERHRAADDSYMDQGIQILNLAQNAHRLFAAQPAKEKRSLLNFLPSNCAWQQGTLTAEFKEPFDMLAETALAAARVEAAEGTDSVKNEIWLPFVDDYRTKCMVPMPDFRPRLEQVTRLGPAA